MDWTNKGKKNPNYIDGRTMKLNYCPDCGIQLKSYLSKKCRKCSNKEIALNNSGLNHPRWKGGKHKCIDCGKGVDFYSKRCSKCSGIYKKGNLNPNWQGGVSFELYPPDWTETLKESIRQRDEYTCQECGTHQDELDRKLDVHHIDYDKDNCNPTNLISLCRPCHVKTNHNRDYWRGYFEHKQRYK